MKLYAPSDYPACRCIAGDCRHSCCIGWEICIDPATLARYKALSPKARKAILTPTVTDKSGTSFRLTKEGRCPHLCSDGLCRLIIDHGEDILCDICREHPRFYNCFSDRTEVGLGLCCEEAARLILTQTAPFALLAIEEDEAAGIPNPFEALFFAQRQENFQILFDRSEPLEGRIGRLAQRYSLSTERLFREDHRWQELYRSLERLDPQWETALSAWEASPALSAPLPQWESAAEQLIAYFLYRHLSDAIDGGDYPERVAFALLSAYLICRIAHARCPDDLPTLIDTARAYSAEVEYSEDNLQAVLEALVE